MAPVTAPVNTIGAIVDPEQMACEDGVASTLGTGLTSTVAVTGMPVHPLLTGVMVNVTFTGAEPVLTSAPLTLPDPLAAIPVTNEVLSLVQI